MTLKQILKLLPPKKQIEFALYCAKSVEQKDPKAISAIKVIEEWLIGKATADQCDRAIFSTETSLTKFTKDNAEILAAQAAILATSYATTNNAHHKHFITNYALSSADFADQVHTSGKNQDQYRLYLLNSLSLLEKLIYGITE